MTLSIHIIPLPFSYILRIFWFKELSSLATKIIIKAPKQQMFASKVKTKGKGRT